MAARALRPPVIDGKDLDQVWRDAQRITEFREFQPHEDGEPRFGTEARVAYDPHNFYVFVRMFEPHPDSILRLMARRDVRTASDQLKIMIDSYRDRRTGYEFAVNPAGVKRDYAIYNDGEEDDAWDAVWEAATTIDSLGWTAEFRIPLSQLRYTPGPSHTFGFGVWRDIQRYTERLSWPLYRVSQAGLVSQLGE
ncbi:MAG: carbohydrate binding family 9 domain-containing protein, partial [Gemmatimonadetes bacterium]|nr:carbohydrate binding family 9 domain-containing protein [Gemmatimonadota bacterium]